MAGRKGRALLRHLQTALRGGLFFIALSNPSQADNLAGIEFVSRHPLAYADPYLSQVWLISQSERLQPYLPEANQRQQLLHATLTAAAEYQLDPDLLLAIMHVESHFDRFAVSRAGAIGVMQIMGFWRQELEQEGANLLDTPTNIRMGSRILHHYLQREQGRIAWALSRYNGSSGQANYVLKVQKWWLYYRF
ncbi:transglycosylase SLT domain-containing protein [Balneatrix alpica]|uniref:transglycosylase SLT domain-containing protein n=1 Tax=Balneatrix alpica TaxID=75684 RepID=UPI002739954E|nr:transglycosylase SLT domain-containing protein [Balneatrix alpica]